MNEMTRKAILAARDMTFIHHGQYSKELPKRNFTGARYKGLKFVSVKGVPQYAVVFNTRSAENPQSVTYEQIIVLLGLRSLLLDKKKKMLMRDAVLKAIADGDMLVWCNDPSETYWGYAYIATQKKINLPNHRETRPPNIRNPRRRGIVCKHLVLCLTILPFNASSIVRDIRKKELKR